jgi:LysR family transcriptional regulator, low CO2-responsive transcriptional regulator
VAIDDRITLNKLKVFALVVELGSVTQAADRLYVAQPVVSAHIRSLEERVGAKLFYREGRSTYLTEAGRTVHAWASDILTRTRELERNLDGLTDGTRGSVVVGASMTVGSYSLPPVLAGFRRERPQVQIRMNILDPDHVIPDTESGENDFAVVLVRVDPSSPGLVAEEIGHEEFVLVAGTGTDPPGPEVSSEELRELWFVEAQARTLRRRHADAAFKQLGLTSRKVAIELGHPEAMKRAVMSGLGVSLMYRSSVTAELEMGALREIQIGGAGWLASPVFLLHRKDKVFSAVQLDLISAIRLEFAGRSFVAPAVA